APVRNRYAPAPAVGLVGCAAPLEPPAETADPVRMDVRVSARGVVRVRGRARGAVRTGPALPAVPGGAGWSHPSPPGTASGGAATAFPAAPDVSDLASRSDGPRSIRP